MKLTASQKLQIAAAYVAGRPIADICQAHGLSASAFYRLRREDPAYREAERCLREEARAYLAQRLSHEAAEAVQTLHEVMVTSADNLTEQQGPNGGKTVLRKVDPKVLQEKRLSADALLTHWARFREHARAQKNWEIEHPLVAEDDDEDEDDEDEEE